MKQQIGALVGIFCVGPNRGTYMMYTSAKYDQNPLRCSPDIAVTIEWRRTTRKKITSSILRVGGIFMLNRSYLYLKEEWGNYMQ